MRDALPLLPDDPVAIGFRSGPGNAEVISEIVGEGRVLGGMTTPGAAIVDPGTVRNFGNPPS